ncbi:MAG: IPT/TIG domain-containing protein [Chloroflexi bacterium]|nr:IPT/TIG domain-containing protein [Chloroflexota bacterium]
MKTGTKIWRTVVAALLLGLSLVSVPATPVKAAVGTITIYPLSGPVGTEVSVTASGFSANITYTVTFSSTNVATGNTSTGSFITNFFVPSYPRGSYAVTATTAADTTNSTASFTVTPDIILSSLSGSIGDTVTVSGRGFNASSTVRIYFDSAVVATTTATASGTFSGVTFAVPLSSRGAHTVKGNDSTGDSPGVSFNSFQKMSITPTSGVVGDKVTVSGSGFAASGSVTIYFDDGQVATASTDSAGGFTNIAFNVPESFHGSHTVKATDAAGNYDTRDFTTNPSLTIDPVSGIAGTKVTVNGTGFSADSVIVISVDASQIATSPAAITTGSKGSFSASFTVPTVASGSHQIQASDGTNTGSKAFTTAPSMSLNPVSGFVGAKAAAKGTGFLANQPITILFDNVSVKTANSDAAGSFNISFDVPVRPAGTYKVKVSDGTNTKEADFTVLTDATIDPATSTAVPGYVGMTVTVSGVGFSAGKTATVTYDGKQIATMTVASDSKFTVTFNTPPSKAGTHAVIIADGINSISRSFIMESTPPSPPTLSKPETDTKTKAEASFDWTEVTDPSGVTYILQVARDKEFGKESIVLEKAGLTLSEYTLTKAEKLESVSKNTPYYWRVKAVDGASNESAWSSARSFYVGIVLSQSLIYVIIGIFAVILAGGAFWLGRKSAYR